MIIGGGLVGCELALHLQQHGHAVTIVEALPDILKAGAPMAPMNEWMLRDLINFHGIQLKTNARLLKITQAGAVIEQSEEESELPADSVIIAVGFRSKSTLFEELKFDYDQIYNLGDGKKVRNIRAAIWEAYEVARSL